jgi:2-polyprenyl-3-methyl-5-hydroxy-6-metoxy-1,4-benzoquinol methylase
MPNTQKQSLRLLAEVRAILRCPRCGGHLTDRTGGLDCASCQDFFPAVDGVVRFVQAEKYAGSFGFQWTVHARTQLDNASSRESETDFRNRTGLQPHDLQGKLVLDVGCGMGRFADIASRWGARVVGVDLSAAAEVAARNLADRKAVSIFRADVFSLPFAPGAFDYIYSLGVLHHTPDCEQAFRKLPPLLKPGGMIILWVYSGYNRWYRMSDLYRRATHRMSSRTLHALCHVAIPMYYVHKALRRLPAVGRPASNLLHCALPISLHPNAAMRVLDTFDWYSPNYQSKHTYEEVFRWFESCGLEDLRVLHEPVSVRGRKPPEKIAADVEERRFTAA